MSFKIIARDETSKIGEIKLNNKNIIFPNILFVDTDRFKSPNFSEINLTDINKNFDEFLDLENKEFFFKFNSNILAVKYANQIFSQTKKFTKIIIENRKKTFYDSLLYIPSIAEPSNLSILAYMGIDFFDSTKAIINARKKTMFFCSGNIKVDDIIENPCTCQICSKLKKKPKEMTFEEILNHNYNILYSELKNVRNHIRNKNLRFLVEKRITSNTNLTSILRILDKDYYDYLEEKTPVASNKTILTTTFESMNRPEIKRFQKRVIDRYKKPKNTKILLMLPCSAKKPYSLSKSHSLFKKALFSSTKNPYVIHDIIITSPLGIVPRELELAYPAKNYDIPVTGTWYEDEKYMIKTLLNKYLQKNKYEVLISHLPEGLNDFIKDDVKIDYFTCIKNPTSEESINNLSEVLKNLSEKYKKIRKSDRIKEDIKELASYQFGRDISKKLLEKTNIKGRYPNLRIMKKNVQLGALVKEKGFISLTLDGGNILFKEKKNFVEIFDDFDLKGSVFAPGIKNADENIRIGDEVIVIRKNKLVGVGSSLMNGREMKNLNYGESVNIRHIKKD